MPLERTYAKDRKRDPAPPLPRGEWLVVGIDPGASGAVAILGSNGFADGRVVDTKDPAALDAAFNDLLDSARAFGDVEILPLRRVYIEDVHSMPGEGHKGVFSFGRAKGVPHGYFAARCPSCDVEFVSPQAWQRMFFGDKLTSMGKDARKEVIRRHAQKAWPEASLARQKDEAVAAALFIASCGARAKRW